MLNKNLTANFTNQNEICILGLNNLPVSRGLLTVKPQHKVLALRFYSVHITGFTRPGKQAPSIPGVPTSKMALGTIFMKGQIRTGSPALPTVIIRLWGDIYHDFDSAAFAGNKVFFWVDNKPRIMGYSLAKVSPQELASLIKIGGGGNHLLDDVYLIVALNTQSDFEVLANANMNATIPAALLLKEGDATIFNP